MDYISVKNLDKYQHYKDRNITWIKWHIQDIDHKFDSLNAGVKWCFISLIGIACKCDNRIEFDVDWLHKQISYKDSKINVKEWIDTLIDSKLIAKCYQDDSKLIAKCYTHKIREDKIRKDIYIASDKPKPKPAKPKKDKKYSSEEFTRLKDRLMTTWNLRGGEYPFKASDAGILGRLLAYGLPKALGILDLGRIMIGEDQWARDRMGTTLRALEYIKAKILDNPRLDSFIKKYETVATVKSPVVFKEMDHGKVVLG